METIETRLHKAIENCAARNVIFTLNAMACCRGCMDEKDVGITDNFEDVIWHFGGQGYELQFENGNPFYVDKDVWDEENEWGEVYTESRVTTHKAEVLYLNHETDHAAQVAVEELQKAGLFAFWSGERHNCVEVIFTKPVTQL